MKIMKKTLIGFIVSVLFVSCSSLSKVKDSDNKQNSFDNIIIKTGNCQILNEAYTNILDFP